MEDEKCVDDHIPPLEGNRVLRAHKPSNELLKVSDEDSHLLDSMGNIKSYKRRWYVLMVFSYAALLQAGVWNTFGPIAQSAKAVFGWTDANIGMLNNWGNIMYVVFMFPVAWLMDVKEAYLGQVHNDDDSHRPEMGQVSDEDSHLLDSTRNIKSYKHRWYVLVVFSFAALLQAGVWNTFGPIAQSAKAVFGWTDANIGMLNNWTNIVYIIFMFPVAWLMDVKGLRISMLLCAALMVFLTAIRCITSEAVPATWLINISAIVNGVVGTVPFGGPALLSATWFPPKQRATATAVSTVFSYLGLSVGFIIECAACVLLLLLVVVYFPAKPPSPPSLTASIERTSYLQGLKGLFTHKRFLVILVAFSVPTGVFLVFGAVLDVVLDGIGITQYHAGWMGFYTTTGGCVAALLMSRISDLFLRRMKMLLLVLFILATTATAWFVMLRLSFIPFSMVSLYVSCILMGVFINGSIPLFYELGCEASYPIAEGVTVGVLTFANNLTGVIFLSVLQIPRIGVAWMTWCILGSVAAAVPLLLLFTEKYTRTDIDTQKTIASEPEKGGSASINTNKKLG
ncbi:solute carrier family 49 member 4 homolog [Haliotis rufescens]|uniref:solute carrier family 49 member 4 homolog n=1 Tax=Haliotis rufescens TaxID=6454 RepID=UPI00201ED44C|nr:solute carrier family 49 member 4 homolog [Haliotis rufescens]